MEIESVILLSEFKSVIVRSIYNLQNVLREVVFVWLEEFFKVKYVIFRIYVKSGVYSMIFEVALIFV